MKEKIMNSNLPIKQDKSLFGRIKVFIRKS